MLRDEQRRDIRRLGVTKPEKHYTVEALYNALNSYPGCLRMPLIYSRP